MNYKISFQERAQLARKALSVQQPVTLQQARMQVEKLNQMSSQKNKKQCN